MRQSVAMYIHDFVGLLFDKKLSGLEANSFSYGALGLFRTPYPPYIMTFSLHKVRENYLFIFMNL